jgi:hypothetical protein
VVVEYEFYKILKQYFSFYIKIFDFVT